MFRPRTSGLFRMAILFLAIFAVLGVSMASTSAQHLHVKPSSSGGQCDICVTAHVVSLEARAVFHLVGAVENNERFTSAETVAGYQLLIDSSASPRGPPSLVDVA